MQRLRRILGMGGPTLRGPAPYNPNRGWMETGFRDMGAVVANTTPTEWSDTPKFTRGGKSLPWGDGLNTNYDAQHRDTMSLRSTLKPAGRELPMADPLDDGQTGMKRDTFTATVHTPIDRDAFNGNRSKSGAHYIVHGQAEVAGKGSQRVTRVSTPQRAKWAAEAMANRVAKTGDVNVRPVKASTKGPDGKRVGKGKGVVSPPQGAVRAERKKAEKQAEGW